MLACELRSSRSHVTFHDVRRDRRSGKLYGNYAEWLRDGRMLWVFSLLLGYAYYLTSTDPVSPV